MYMFKNLTCMFEYLDKMKNPCVYPQKSHLQKKYAKLEHN